MKFLKLKFEHARIIKDKKKGKNLFGTNIFFYPITKMHIYNSVCVLLDRTPKPQLRDTDDKYMPLYEDVLSAVSDGYIKTNLISTSEMITAIKKNWDSNSPEGDQYTWKDCRYMTGTLHSIFVFHLSQLLKKSESVINKLPFEDVIEEIRKMGVVNDKGEIIYTNEAVNDLIGWCKTNTATGLANYIENKQISSKPTQFGKRVFRGDSKADKYSGFIYIPLNEDLYEELITHTKGFSNILDGGLVTIVDYSEIFEDELIGFTKIENLNCTRKFDLGVNNVKMNNTIYRDLDKNNLESSIKSIITKCGISIKDNQEAYDTMMVKVGKDKFEKIGYKINYFIEKTINKQYK